MRYRLDADLEARVGPQLRSALGAFECAVESASASQCLRLDAADIARGRPVVIGAGKAAAAMAIALSLRIKARASANLPSTSLLIFSASAAKDFASCPNP